MLSYLINMYIQFDVSIKCVGHLYTKYIRQFLSEHDRTFKRVEYQFAVFIVSLKNMVFYLLN